MTLIFSPRLKILPRLYSLTNSYMPRALGQEAVRRLIMKTSGVVLFNNFLSRIIFYQMYFNIVAIFHVISVFNNFVYTYEG